MTTVSMREARTHLSTLIERAILGETIVIARAGTPLVRISAFDSPSRPRRLGFLAGEIVVPDNFDTMADDEISLRFGE